MLGRSNDDGSMFGIVNRTYACVGEEPTGSLHALNLHRLVVYGSHFLLGGPVRAEYFMPAK